MRRVWKRVKRPVLVGLGVLAGLVLVLSLRLGPLVEELALAEATDAISVTVHQVVTEKIAEEHIVYSDLVSLEKDGSGAITALTTNMAGINYLQSEITAAVIARFAQSDVTRVRIPLGSLFGGTLLAGRGPAIPVDMLSVTNVFTAFKNEFSAAGINQTHHRILMEVEVTLAILPAGFSGARTRVTTEITVAETVIVGRVPGTYAAMGE